GKRRRTLAAADDLAVALGCEQVNSQCALGPFLVDLEVKTLDRGRKMMHEHRQPELFRQISFVRRTKISAPLKSVLELALFVPLLKHFDRVVVVQPRERALYRFENG